MKVVGVWKRDRGLGRGGRGKEGEESRTKLVISLLPLSLLLTRRPLSHWGKHLKNGDCNVSVSLKRVT